MNRTYNLTIILELEPYSNPVFNYRVAYFTGAGTEQNLTIPRTWTKTKPNPKSSFPSLIKIVFALWLVTDVYSCYQGRHDVTAGEFISSENSCRQSEYTRTTC